MIEDNKSIEEMSVEEVKDDTAFEVKEESVDDFVSF